MRSFNIKKIIRKIVDISCGNIFSLLPQSVQYNIRGRWRLPFTEKYISSKYGKQIHEDLCQIIKNSSKPSIFFLPTHTWFSSAFQRPQQMARALSDIGCSVIYYESWSHNQKLITKIGLKERRFIGIRNLAPCLYLLRCPESTLVDFLSDCQPDFLLMLWPYQAEFIPQKTSSFVIYEMIDDHEIISEADDNWKKIHKEWVHKADIMIATADDLLAQLSIERPNTLLLPNGVCIEDWKVLERRIIPEDMITILNNASVIVGYYGIISEWFDWNLWTLAAKSKPNWAFVLIGPYDIKSDKIIDKIKNIPNIYYLGPKPYSSLRSYVAHFDIATIPFIVNQITHACSPLKLFEYMAAGKPIVATPMREIVKYKSVLIAENEEKFIYQLDEALLKKDDPEYKSILKKEAEENSWKSRAEILLHVMERSRLEQNNIPRHQME